MLKVLLLLLLLLFIATQLCSVTVINIKLLYVQLYHCTTSVCCIKRCVLSWDK